LPFTSHHSGRSGLSHPDECSSGSWNTDSSHETSKHKFKDLGGCCYSDAGLGASIQSHCIDTVHEPGERQALPAGKAALGGPHLLRVLSSEAVPNSFPTSTELLAHRYVREENRQNFARPMLRNGRSRFGRGCRLKDWRRTLPGRTYSIRKRSSRFSRHGAVAFRFNA
jgi:hypothetical protein